MSNTLPSLGRKGIATVRRISGIDNPGWNAVDSAADIIAGMVAQRATDSSGNTVLKVCDATEIPVGIFYLHKTLNFYVSVIDEAVTIAATNTLAHASVKNVLIENTSTGVAYTETTDYTVNTTNGIITTVTIAVGTAVKVSYLYKDTETTGVDQTVPTGLISILQGPGEIGTFIYDTEHAVAINDILKCDADGFLSTDSTLTGKTIGIVTKAPTASDPELIFNMNIQL